MLNPNQPQSYYAQNQQPYQTPQNPILPQQPVPQPLPQQLQYYQQPQAFPQMPQTPQPAPQPLPQLAPQQNTSAQELEQERVKLDALKTRLIQTHEFLKQKQGLFDRLNEVGIDSLESLNNLLNSPDTEPETQAQNENPYSDILEDNSDKPALEKVNKQLQSQQDQLDLFRTKEQLQKLSENQEFSFLKQNLSDAFIKEILFTQKNYKEVYKQDLDLPNAVKLARDNLKNVFRNFLSKDEIEKSNFFKQSQNNQQQLQTMLNQPQNPQQGFPPQQQAFPPQVQQPYPQQQQQPLPPQQGFVNGSGDRSVLPPYSSGGVAQLSEQKVEKPAIRQQDQMQLIDKIITENVN